MSKRICPEQTVLRFWGCSADGMPQHVGKKRCWQVMATRAALK